LNEYFKNSDMNQPQLKSVDCLYEQILSQNEKSHSNNLPHQLRVCRMNCGSYSNSEHDPIQKSYCSNS
jgi:hypothetical protein